MSKTVTITLQEPISGHNGPVREVVIRPPLAADYFEFGDPQVAARAPDGSFFVVEDDAALRGYIERCVVSPDALLIRQLSLVDAIAVKKAVMGFFQSALAASPTPQSALTPSSSN